MKTRTLECAHKFHFGCVSEWLLRQNGQNSCPMCRATVASNVLLSMREERIREDAYAIAEKSGFTKT